MLICLLVTLVVCHMLHTAKVISRHINICNLLLFTFQNSCRNQIPSITFYCNQMLYSVFKKPCHGIYFIFLAGVCLVSQQPPKMDSYPFWKHVAQVILTTKCLKMYVATVNAIIYVCRSVLHIGIAVLTFIYCK